MANLSSGEAGPQFEAPTPPESIEQQGERQVEQNRPAHPEAAPKAPAQAAPAVNLPQPSPQQPTTAPATPTDQDDGLTSAPSARLRAADGKLIEKEWVAKTKQVVAQTRNDPFSQKNEISLIKADYVKKRFNKQIKTGDPLSSTQGQPELGPTGDAVAA